MAERALRGSGLGSKSFADGAGVEFAARQEIGFDCPKEHHFAVTFAEEAELPTEWECPRCGSMARRSDGVEPIVKPTKPPRPGSAGAAGAGEGDDDERRALVSSALVEALNLRFAAETALGNPEGARAALADMPPRCACVCGGCGSG